MTRGLRQLLAQAPLYAIFDPALRPELAALEVAREWLDAGVRVIQYRRKGSFTRHDFERCRALARLIQESGGLFFVNDRADVAAISGAAGVHLGQTDLPPRRARPLLPEGALIGYSTHNRDQVMEADAEPVDYIGFGPVYPTRTKENPDPVVGTQGIADARRHTSKPLIGIGGIRLENAAVVLAAGADAVAVISDLLPPAATLPDIRRRAEDFLAALKRPESLA